MRKYDFYNAHSAKANQTGNVLFTVVVILLTLVLLTMMCMHSVTMQQQLVTVRRETSNTYYLAKSAVEQQVANMNADLEEALETILQKVSKEYVSQLTNFANKEEKLVAMKGSDSCKKYDQFIYENGQIKVKEEILTKRLQDEIYEFMVAHYLNKECLNYEVVGDYNISEYKTMIKVKVLPIKEQLKGREIISQTTFKVMAMAMTQNIKDNTLYDTQNIEAKIKINIHSNLTNIVHETYTWAARPSEILASGLVSFSDVVITEGGCLEVVNGDLMIKGSGNTYEGEVFRNGESLGAGVTQMGGLIVSNGGKLKVQNGDVVTMGNVVATNGWSGEMGKYNLDTSIEVLRGDIIAHTVGIVDDYYKQGENQTPFEPMWQGSNLSIHVGQNVFVDDDVLISKWIKNGEMTIGGTIFGISDGSEGADKWRHIFNPNISSGVFAQGKNTQILAERILVNGQPYISVENSALPMKLWESVGQPFDEIDLWEGYERGIEQETNKDYLKEDSPYYDFIHKDQIKLYNKDIAHTSYAPGKVSANGIISVAEAITEKTAKKLFMKGFEAGDLSQGNMPYQLANYTHRGDYEGFEYILAQTRNKPDYYKGSGEDYRWYEQPLMYGKCYTEGQLALKSNYLGLRGYMSAKRSVFYGKMDEKDVPQLLSFEEVIEELPVQTHKQWSESNPIIVINSGDAVIDISKLYQEKEQRNGSYPSLIINSGGGTLTLTATKQNQNILNGIVISKGNVRVKESVQVNGSIIIGGQHEGLNPEKRETRMCGKTEINYSPGLVIGNGAHLKICYDADMLFKVNLIDQVVYRRLLDALKITRYHSQTALKDILGPYQDEKLKYSVGKVFYKEDSILDICLESIRVNIEVLKKSRD